MALQLISPRGIDLSGGNFVSVEGVSSLSFGNGLTDLPYSIFARVRLDQYTSMPIVAKSFSHISGEYQVGVYADGHVETVRIDNSSGGIRGRGTPDSKILLGLWYSIITTFDGTSDHIFINGVSSDSYAISTGAYTAMEPSDNAVEIGHAVFTGVGITGVELSECEVRALTARMQRQAGTR